MKRLSGKKKAGEIEAEGGGAHGGAQIIGQLRLLAENEPGKVVVRRLQIGPPRLRVGPRERIRQGRDNVIRLHSCFAQATRGLANSGAGAVAEFRPAPRPQVCAVATAGLPPGLAGAGGEAPRARKLLHQFRGSRPRAMIAAWLATKIISHLKAASMKP